MTSPETMAVDAAVSAICSTRGCLFVPEMNREVAPYRASHLRDFAALQEYSATLPEETRGWMLALFVDSDFGLLSVETIARGSTNVANVSVERLIGRGLRLKAVGFLLVHNHPYDPTSSPMKHWRERSPLGKAIFVLLGAYLGGLSSN